MTDVVVSGGGPAGLAVALCARSRGLSVRVVDRARPPIDKSCGEGLLPDGAALLAAMGVRVPGGRCAPFAGIRWIDGDTTAEARFGRRPGLGIRRTALHDAMVRAAEAGGVDLAWGTTVLGPIPGGLATSRGAMHARFVVAADGQHSRLRRTLGLDRPVGGRWRYGVSRHYAVRPWSDCVEVYWGDRRQAYVTPLSDEEVGVAILWRGAPASFDALIGEFPAVSRRIGGAARTSDDLGAAPLERHVRAVVAGRVALVGDAAGSVDAIAGEGLSIALAEAAAAIEAICRDDLGAYASAHRRLLRLPRMAARLMLTLDDSSTLRRRVVTALGADPELFSRLLALHAREVPLWPAILGVIPRLALRLAWPGPAGRRREAG